MMIFPAQSSSTDVKSSVTNFSKLIHTLVDNQRQGDIFYQVSFLTLDVLSFESHLFRCYIQFD